MSLLVNLPQSISSGFASSSGQQEGSRQQADWQAGKAARHQDKMAQPPSQLAVNLTSSILTTLQSPSSPSPSPSPSPSTPTPDPSSSDELTFLSSLYLDCPLWLTSPSSILTFSVAFTFLFSRFGFSPAWLLVILSVSQGAFALSARRFRRDVRSDLSRSMQRVSLRESAESAGWINAFLERFWVQYEPLLSATVVASVDELLDGVLPPFLSSLALSTFTLGTQAPRINSVKTWPDTEMDVVQMDWSVSFDNADLADLPPSKLKLRTNPKVVLTIGIGPTKVDVLLENIAISANLRIRMQLISNFPNVKLIDISLLDPLEFDYVLKPLGGDKFGFDINNIPGLSAFIRSQVHSNLGPIMYAPNVFTVNLEQMLSGNPLDAACGVVQITLKSARGIKGTKLGGGSPDPYVAVSLGAGPMLARTKAKRSTYSPHWAEVVFVLVTSLLDSLTLTLLDHNDHRKDAEMGKATFGLTALSNDPEIDNIKSVILSDGKDRGQLMYDLAYYPVMVPQVLPDGNVEALPDSRSGLCRITIHAAKDLGNSSSEHQVDASASLYLKTNLIHTTPTVKKKISPVWESYKEFMVIDKPSAVISIKISDHRDSNGRSSLGYVTMKLEDMFESLEKGEDWFPLQSGGNSKSRIRVSAVWRPLAVTGSLEGSASFRPPIGIVRLHAKKAAGVQNVEQALGGKSDPYLRISIGGRTVGRTEYIANNLDPEWDEILYIPVHNVKQTLVLEAMDYQNMTRDRSLGSCELKMSDLCSISPDFSDTSPQSHASTGKLTKSDALHLGKANIYKGTVYYEAEFIPATLVKGMSFAGLDDPVAKSIHDELASDRTTFNDSNGMNSGSTSPIVQISSPTPSTSTFSALQSPNTAYAPSQLSLNLSHKRSSSDASMRQDIAEQTKSRGVEDIGAVINKEQLIKHQSGLLIVNVLSAMTPKAGVRLEMLIDDSSWPAFTTEPARTKQAKWDMVGEGFIRELDFSRVRFRLNEGLTEERDSIVASLDISGKDFLEKTLNAVAVFSLEDQNGDAHSTITLESKYSPINIKLTPRESITNSGSLRVDILSASGLRSADRNGKSDPFVCFELDKVRCYKTEVKKATLSPVWNEHFETDVRSRVAADLRLNVYDWDRGSTSDFLGGCAIDLKDLEAFTAVERSCLLNDPKKGPKGQVELRLLFKPSFIIRTRKNTSTFRSLTHVGSAGVRGVGGVGKGVATGVFHGAGAVAGGALHGVGAVGSAVIGRRRNTLSSIKQESSTSGMDGSAPPTKGTLRVHLLAAKDFKSGHSNEQAKPYVTLQLLGVAGQQKSRKLEKTSEPYWDEVFVFETDPQSQTLILEMLDSRALLKDKELGEASVPIWQHLQPSAGLFATEIWVELKDGQGQIQIGLSWSSDEDYSATQTLHNAASKVSLVDSSSMPRASITDSPATKFSEVGVIDYAVTPSPSSRTKTRSIFGRSNKKS